MRHCFGDSSVKNKYFGMLNQIEAINCEIVS